MRIALKIAASVAAGVLVALFILAAVHRGDQVGLGGGSLPLADAALLLVVTAAFGGGAGLVLVDRPLSALGDQVRLLSAERESITMAASDREEAIEALRRTERLATVSKLASVVAHELGTPLNVIAARASMIVAGEAVEQEAIDSARIIAEQANRMSRTMKEVLASVRKGKPVKKSTEVGELLHRSSELVSRMASKQKVTIEIDGELESHRVEVDESRIVQALINLITNSIQAMPSGGTISIRVSKVPAAPEEYRAPTGYSCISVRDTGVGISSENLKAIFKPFFTTKSDSLGTGLGLAVAEGIVREHGGWMDVESEIARGSCFKVCLPVGG